MNEPQSLTRGFRFQTDLNDWWVRLRSGAVLRLWGSEMRITSDELQFGAVSANDLEWVELSAVSLVVVDEVVQGQGVNGSPANAYPESGPVVWRRDSSTHFDPSAHLRDDAAESSRREPRQEGTSAAG